MSSNTIALHKLPIETERLVIRKLEKDDLSKFLEFMLDAERTKYLAFTEEQKTKEGATELFEFVLGSYDGGQPIESFAVCLKNSNEYIGSVGFASYGEGVFGCYYFINKDYFKKAYAKKAMSSLLKGIQGEVVVRAHCSPENRPAHKLAESLGIKPKGEVKHKHNGLKGLYFERPVA
ncbi:MAG: GNAT family N-acetyltransferase [Bdellovibrionales bacterium]